MSLGKSDPGRTRTYNPRLRRPMPYPLGAGQGRARAEPKQGQGRPGQARAGQVGGRGQGAGGRAGQGAGQRAGQGAGQGGGQRSHRTCAGAELETERRHCHLATIQSLQLIRAPCPAANFSTDGLAQKQFAVFGTAALHVCASSETPRHDSNKQAYPTTQQWQINLSQLLTSGLPHKKLTAP